MLDFIIKMAFYLAPMYFANSSAMLLGGKTRIDFGAKLADGRPLFGQGKTVRGTIGGVAVGTTVGFLLNYFFAANVSAFFVDYKTLAFTMAIGAIAGDIVGSFLKRRLGVPPGTKAPFLDQLDFAIGGIIFGMIIYTPTFVELVFAAALTIVVHRLSNFVAYKLKLKKVPW